MARKGLEILSFGNRDIVYGVRLLLWLDMDDGKRQQTILGVEGAARKRWADGQKVTVKVKGRWTEMASERDWRGSWKRCKANRLVRILRSRLRIGSCRSVDFGSQLPLFTGRFHGQAR